MLDRYLIIYLALVEEIAGVDLESVLHWIFSDCEGIAIPNPGDSVRWWKSNWMIEDSTSKV